MTYSGTVSAALESVLLGVPGAGGVARRADHARELPAGGAGRRPADAAPAARTRRPVTLLNVNVPPGQPRGVRITRLGRRLYSEKVVERQDPRGRRYFWIGVGPPAWEAGEDTDHRRRPRGLRVGDAAACSISRTTRASAR